MTPHLIPPHQLVAAALVAMEEARFPTSRAPDLRLEVPTSIDDPEATMRLIHAMTTAHRAPREVGAATATRRLINPSLTTFITTSMLAHMFAAASKIVGPHATMQRWSVAGNSTPNMRGLLPVNYHFLPAHQDFAPSPKGSEPSGDLLVSRSLVLTPMTEGPTPLSG